MVDVNKFLDFKTEQARFKLDYFVCLKAGKTPYGTFKQACLEMKSRHASIFNDLCDLELEKEKKHENKIEQIRSNVAIQMREREIARKQREYKRFLEVASYLDAEYKFTEKTESEIEELELEKWYHDLGDQMAAQMLSSGGRLDANFLRIVRDCPPYLKKRFEPLIYTPEGRKKMQDHFMNSQTYQLPEKIPVIEMKEHRLLDFVEKNDVI